MTSIMQKFADTRAKLQVVGAAVGRKSVGWFVASLVCAPLLATAEFMIAASTELLLKTLGMSSSGNPYLARLSDFTPTQVGLLFCVIGLVRGACLYISAYASYVVEVSLLSRFRQVALHQMLLDQRRQFLSVSTVSFRFGELFGKASQCVSAIVSLVPQFLLASGLMLFMWFIDAQITLLATSGIGCIGVGMMALHRLASRTSKQQIPIMENLIHRIQRIGTNRLLIRVLRTEHRELHEFSQLNERSSEIFLRSRSWSIILATLPPVLGLMLLAGIIGVYAQRPDGSAVRFVLFLYLLSRLVLVLSLIASYMGNIAPLFPHLKLAMRIFMEANPVSRRNAIDSLKTGRLEPKVKSLPLASSAGRLPPEVTLKNVYFGYEADNLIVNGLSLTAVRGEQLGIVGVSGSGKTTVLAMIVGILTPSKGEIAIDGLDVEQYLGQPGAVVGYVGAEPFLFEGTIKENLDYGAVQSYTDADYRRTFALANFDSVMKRMPDGLNHRLVGDGFGLSSGEKQRLALVRALLRSPTLLILDEFTANVDAKTEHDITESLRRLKGICTCIIVSHRPSVFKYASSIHDLSNGQNVTFADLMRRAG